jgi:hypothetical protein
MSEGAVPTILFGLQSSNQWGIKSCEKTRSIQYIPIGRIETNGTIPKLSQEGAFVHRIDLGNGRIREKFVAIIMQDYDAIKPNDV